MFVCVCVGGGGGVGEWRVVEKQGSYFFHLSDMQKYHLLAYFIILTIQITKY